MATLTDAGARLRGKGATIAALEASVIVNMDIVEQRFRAFAIQGRRS